MNDRVEIDLEPLKRHVGMLRQRRKMLLAEWKRLEKVSLKANPEARQELVELHSRAREAQRDLEQGLALLHAVVDLTAAAERPEIKAAPAVRELLVQLRDGFATRIEHVGKSVSGLLPEFARQANQERARRPRRRDRLTDFIEKVVRRNPQTSVSALYEQIEREAEKPRSWIKSTGGGVASNYIVYVDGNREKKLKVDNLRGRLHSAKKRLQKS